VQNGFHLSTCSFVWLPPEVSFGIVTSSSQGQKPTPEKKGKGVTQTVQMNAGQESLLQACIYYHGMLVGEILRNHGHG
jgi:hypothetical protein